VRCSPTVTTEKLATIRAQTGCSGAKLAEPALFGNFPQRKLTNLISQGGDLDSTWIAKPVVHAEVRATS
jgi:hypothetical protein